MEIRQINEEAQCWGKNHAIMPDLQVLLGLE